ncbi:MAG: hypothetical protein QG608_968 [Actinomycetota bacterium]|nr:hypothetical protein [Actinomycetota bacterium]
MAFDGLIEHLCAATATALVSAVGTEAWSTLRARLGGFFDREGRHPLTDAVDQAAHELSSTSPDRRHELEEHHRRILHERLAPSISEGTLTAVDLVDLLDLLVRASCGAATQHAVARDRAQQAVQFSGEQSNRFGR